MSNTAKILLVDDEPGMLRYIRTLLEVDDYKVETASTGEEALERVQKGLQPDLVLLDLLMPGIDGLETLEQLRQLRPGVKVVMLSCVSDTRKVVQAIRLGAHDYLTKPFQKAELDAVVDQCLGINQQNYVGEVEELCDDVFFVAASPAMRKIRSQSALDLPHGGAGGYEEYVITKLFHFANIVLLIDAKALIDYRVEFGFLERLGQIGMCSQPYSLYYLAGIADAGEHDYLYPRPELPQLLECLQPINAGHQQV